MGCAPTQASQMLYAFSRDGAVPFSNFWHQGKRSRVPVRTAWFGAIRSLVLSLPYIWNSVAYFAVTSMAVVGLSIAYWIPIFLRRVYSRDFVPGPCKLGAGWGPLISWIAIIWAAFICILLLLPQVSDGVPGSADFSWPSFNYAPIVVLVVVGGAGPWYLVSARKWHKGPKVKGTPEELAEIERDLGL